jgi:hypothetical protein
LLQNLYSCFYCIARDTGDAKETALDAAKPEIITFQPGTVNPKIVPPLEITLPASFSSTRT